MSQIDNPSEGHVIEDEGIPLPQRKNLNFIGDSVTVTDNEASNETDVLISGTSSSANTPTRAFAYFIS